MGENVYKRDRFLGKFKKGPPHIGEYDKNDILEEVDLTVVRIKTPSVMLKRHLNTQNSI